MKVLNINNLYQKLKFKKKSPDLSYYYQNIKFKSISILILTRASDDIHHFYENLSLTLYSWKGWCFCGVWEMGGETYTQREDFFLYLLPGARWC